MHLVMIIPDLVQEPERMKYIVATLNILNKTNDVLSKIGGSPTHLPYLVIGGSKPGTRRKTLVKLLEALDKLNRSVKYIMRIL